MARLRFWNWSSLGRRRPTSKSAPRKPRLGLEELESRTVPANIHIAWAGFVDAQNNPITTPVVGERLTLRAEWTTTGLNTANQYKVHFAVDGYAVESGFVGGPPGVNQTMAHNVTGFYAGTGEHVVQVTLDVHNAILESDETDNAISFTFSTQSPNLPGKFIWPLAGVPGQDWTVVSYHDVDPRPGFGADYRGGPYQYDGHEGLDLAVPNFAAMDAGLSVYAAAAGVVTQVQDGYFDRETSFNGNPANFVVIDHGSGWQTIYAHLARFSIPVKVGQTVAVGQMLGLVGSSGSSTGPHLHFEVRHNGAPVETSFLSEAFFLHPRLYQNDQAPTVLDAGITNYPGFADFNERPSEILTFPTARNWEVWYWFRLSHLPTHSTIEVHWYRPDGTLDRTDSTQSNSVERFGAYGWPLPADAWSGQTGLWKVVAEVNGTEVDRRSFEVVAGDGLPEMRVAQGTTYILDGRLTPIDFGEASAGSPAVLKSFTIQNHGSAPLTVGNLTLPAGFTLAGTFPATVVSGGSAVFVLELDTSRIGRRFGEVRFTSNDADESVFTFTVEGLVTGNPLAGTPVIAMPGPTVMYNLGAPPVVLDPSALLADSDSTYFGNGNLRAALASGGTPDDRLGVRNQGTGAGQIGVAGTGVTYAGTLIGSLAGGIGLTPLIVALNSNATIDAVQALIRNLTFSTTSGSADSQPRVIGMAVTDETGKVSADCYKAVVTHGAPPTITGLGDQTTDEDTPADPLAFQVGDEETPAANLMLEGWSSDPSLVPHGNIHFSGSGTTRQVAVAPAADRSGVVTITVRVTDANGASATTSFQLDVLAVNDAPSFKTSTVASGLEDGGPWTYPGFAAAVDPGAPDEMDQGLAFDVLVLQTTGTLAFLVPPTIGADGTLSFVALPDTHGTATVRAILRDDGGTANGGLDTSPPLTFTIELLPVNDAPSFALAGDPAPVLEDAGPVVVPGFAFDMRPGPLDEWNQQWTFLASVIGTTGGLTFAQVPAIDPFTGQLTFRTSDHASGTATVEVRLRDDGGTAHGGLDMSAPRIFVITVESVVDPPTVTAPAGLTFHEDEAAFVNGITVLDDTPGDQMRLVLRSTNGRLTVRTGVPGGLTAANVLGNGTDTLVLTGTSEAISATLANAEGLAFRGQLNYFGGGQLVIQAFDLSQPGEPMTDSDLVIATVLPVNDAPVVTMPGEQTVIRNGSLGLGNGIQVADIDAGSGIIQVTASVNAGRLTVGSASGLIDLQGNGGSVVVLTGSVAAINAALNGMVFSPAIGFTGQAALTVTANDLGNTGAVARSATGVAAITVTPLAPEVLNERWTFAAYLDLLGRGPDGGELAATTARLNAGTDYAAIVREITRTVEYQTREIQRLHRDVLGRSATDREVSRYLNLLGRGATYQYLTAQIIGGVKSQRKYLGAFATKLAGGRLSRKQKTRLIKTTNRPSEAIRAMRNAVWVRQLVDGLVRRFLDRSATGDELNDYANRMLSGASDTATPAKMRVPAGAREEQIIASILGSKPYLDVL